MDNCNMEMEFRTNTFIAWPRGATRDESVPTGPVSNQKAELINFRFERVIHVDSDTKEIFAIDTHDSKAQLVSYTIDRLTAIITSDKARMVVGYEPYPVLTLTDEELGDSFLKQFEYRDKAWELIEPLLKIEIRRLLSRKIRGAVIADIARRTGRDEGKVRFHLRRYFQRGCVKNSLFPDWHKRGLKGTEVPGKSKRGRPTTEKKEDGQSVGINVTEQDKEKFRKGIADYVTTGTSSDLRAAWQRIKEDQYSTGTFRPLETDEGIVLSPVLLPSQEIPTCEQFTYYYRLWREPAKEIIVQFGKDEYARNVRPVLGSVLEEAPYPGALFQIDAAIGDFYLVNDFQRERLIGRPVIYIVIDTFSRRIVGWAVTLEGPNWTGARLALVAAFESEGGLCEALIGDNGEIKGYNANSLVNPLQVRVVNAPAWRPDWKPIVERAFLTLKGEYIDFVPGRVFQRRRFRGPDYRLDAMLSLNGFRKIFARSIAHYNSTHLFKDYPLSPHMIQKGVTPIPDELWKYGVKHLGGALRGIENIEKMKLSLLPKSHASIQRGDGEGIYFKGLHYVCRKGLEEGWFERKGQPHRSFTIAYEQVVDRIYLCLDHGRTFEPCVLTKTCERFAGKDWFDVKDYFAWKRVADNRTAGMTQQSDADFHAEIENIVVGEIAATAASLASANLSRSERIKGIKIFRDQLKAYERKFGPVSNVTQLPAALSGEAVSPERPAMVVTPEDYVAPARPTDEIRAAMNKQGAQNESSRY